MKRVREPDWEDEYDGTLPLDMLCKISRYLDRFSRRMLNGTCRYVYGRIRVKPLLFKDPCVTDEEGDMVQWSMECLVKYAPLWIIQEAMPRIRASERLSHLIVSRAVGLKRDIGLDWPTLFSPEHVETYAFHRAVNLGRVRAGEHLDFNTFHVTLDDSRFFDCWLTVCVTLSPSLEQLRELVMDLYVSARNATESHLLTYTDFLQHTLLVVAARHDDYFPLFMMLPEFKGRFVGLEVLLPNNQFIAINPARCPLWFQHQWKTAPRFLRSLLLYKHRRGILRTSLPPDYITWLERRGFVLIDTPLPL
jgi:hypothetical protein